MRLLFLLTVLLFSLGISYAQDEALVNLNHLKFLTETVTIEGEAMALVHIYSETPEYEWVDAAGEGLAAVDDVARAAIVYLWHYEQTGDTESLELARNCLNFVMYMQAEDGEFYNFVTDAQGTINRTGNTSYKSLTWWAMRGLWAFGEGIRVFDSADPAYAERLTEAYLRTETALAASVSSSGEYITLHGFEIPAWIPGGESTVASIGLLGLASYYQAVPNEATAELMTIIADGIAEYRLGDHLNYPWGMHPVRSNTPGFHHTWAAAMPHALVMAGMALGREDWIESAAAEADSFLLRQLAFEQWRHVGVVPDRRGQIAYGTNMLVQAYANLYRATGEERYARFAGLSASWYFGNNMAGVQMYQPETGRVFDGINGPVDWRVNRNSGAESTIEGLMSLLAIADIPLAQDYLHVREVSSTPFMILQAEDGQRVVGTPIYYTGDWTGAGYLSAGRYIGLGEGQRMRLPFEIEQEDDYLVYVAHVRQANNSEAFTIPHADSPRLIDADSSDWPADWPSLSSNSSQQFLRGAGLWEGEEVDSHHVYLAWDTEKLYILAKVRDPEHEQPYTLSTVWQGDTLWFYMSQDPNQAQRLSAKFTLAQTPEGSQVWDWIDTGFVEGAQLAFTQEDGGYTYEAAIPWASLKLEIAAGQHIGFEVGRGVGGNSFMDLTGRDPDVAANLLNLVLVDDTVSLDSSNAPQVALEVRVDEHDSVVIPQTVSPDSDYFWLDLVTEAPIHLSEGEHFLRYEYAGEGGSSSNPGISKIDAFYLQPATAHRVYALPDGRQIDFTYNTLSGEMRWEESQGE
jgi:hypothetical protein